MKNTKIFFIIAFLTAGLLVGQDARAQFGGSVSFQTFYNELSPYGNWSSHPKYGSVWTPYGVGRNFQPYGTDGHWVMTEFGNTWVSDFQWGWATFHYGRWFYDDYLGWAWVPDYEWGPAWVDWRSGNGYYGWAPLWPGVRIGVSFNIPLNYWVFVPQRYIYNRRVFGYCVPRYRYRSFFGRTTIINNYYYNDNRSYAYGPSRGEVERVTRGNVPTYRAEEIRGNRYASNNGSGTSNRTYRADDYSRSGLDRQSRDTGGSISGRTYDAGTSGRSSRTYDANDSGISNGRSSYESSAPSSSRTYDATESSSRSRSGSSYESGSRSSSTPSYDSNESRSRSSSSAPSYDSGNNSSSSSPSVSSPSYESRSRSSAPQTRSAPSVRSAPSQPSSSRSRNNSSYSAPSRSSSRSSSAPSMSSRSSSQSSAARSSAPSSSSRSSSSSSSSRSRGPR